MQGTHIITHSPIKIERTCDYPVGYLMIKCMKPHADKCVTLQNRKLYRHCALYAAIIGKQKQFPNASKSISYVIGLRC